MVLHVKKISQQILKDRYNSLIFREGRGKVCLVGGFIRDIIRGVQSHDRDYIVFRDLVSFVKQIRAVTGGTLVEFKNEGMVRIALKGGDTLDFSKPQGSLEEDLSKRDFTVNAIAWSPQCGIVDLCNGVDDIKKRIVRSLARENFIADPLRILRAYRIAAELDASIENKTRLMIKSLQNTMDKVSLERITLEFFRLLNSSHSNKYLKIALYDGVLSDILSFDYNTLERAIRAVSHLEKTYFNILPATIKVKLNKIFSQNLTYKGLLCLETLLADNFHKTQPLLEISNAIQRRIRRTGHGISSLPVSRNITKDALFDMFEAVKDGAIDTLIVARRIDLLTEYRRYLRITQNGFISSDEIVGLCDTKTGSQIGEIIRALKKAQFTGEITSRRQAFVFLRHVSATMGLALQ